jgi:hypothetical protein
MPKPNKRWIIGLIFIVAIVGYFIFVLEFQSWEWLLSQDQSPTPLATPTPVIDKSINFDHIGNFVMSDPKLKSDQFYLIYETSGNPALTVRLYFTAKSQCQTDNALQSCPRPTFTHGDRVHILGIRQTNYVIVKNAIYLGP